MKVGKKKEKKIVEIISYASNVIFGKMKHGIMGLSKLNLDAEQIFTDTHVSVSCFY